MNDVKRLARWTGWCDPCETDRPLVLTETGRGLRSWLRGTGQEDRDLTLTCVVCGAWQDVPYDEADDPDVDPRPLPAIAAVQPLGVHHIVLVSAPEVYPAEPGVPGPRPAPPIATDEFTLALVSAGLDLLTADRQTTTRRSTTAA